MVKIQRCDNRSFDSMRKLEIEINPLRYAEGSCMVHLGHTRVLCSASVDNSVPSFMRGSKRGWVTAEYAMLPRATQERSDRRRQLESARSKEIQRLIGRSLRSVVDMEQFADKQVRVDCDVIEADGGTRSASVIGGFMAMSLAFLRLCRYGILEVYPVRHNLAALSCGVLGDDVICDLDYSEDSAAVADANFVMSDDGRIVELQATGERHPFSEEQFSVMLGLVRGNIDSIFSEQARLLSLFSEGLE